MRRGICGDREPVAEFVARPGSAEIRRRIVRHRAAVARQTLGTAKRAGRLGRRRSPARCRQARAALGRSEKKRGRTARLVKSGVLSKVEAEQRALRVVRLEAELAKAELSSAQRQL